MKRTSQLLVGLLVVLVAAIAPTVASGTTGTLTITQNTTLTENHQGNIVIAANNITLDCAGHMVTGSGDGIGVDLSGHSGVTVKNCRVTDFNIGFFMIGGGGNTLIGNTANTISGNAFRVFSANNILIGNKADGTGSPDSAEGFFVSYIFGSKYNLLQRNEATNFQCGFRLSADPTTDNTLTGNVASSNTVGFCLLEVSRNTLTGNVANNNGTGFQIAGTAPGHLTTGNTLSGNVANNNAGAGFDLIGGAVSNTLTQNKAMSNTSGFVPEVGATGNTLTRNVAQANNEWDAQDLNGPGLNTWLNNVFGKTSGL